jgi:hypothetical protein
LVRAESSPVFEDHPENDNKGYSSDAKQQDDFRCNKTGGVHKDEGTD